MSQRALGLALAAGAVMCASSAWADITSVSATGPGGPTPVLSISTIFKPMDTVDFSAIYTADDSIVLTLNVEGGGAYHIGGSISNRTGAPFNSFSCILLGAPAEPEIYAVSFDRDNVFGGPPVFEPDEAAFNGPNGLAVNFQTVINVDFILPRFAGTDTFEVVLTPLSPSTVTSRPEPPPISVHFGSGPVPAPVPEASTWALMLVGLAGPLASDGASSSLSGQASLERMDIHDAISKFRDARS